MQPAANGRFYERCVNGSECEWGRVLVWEPPRRVVLAWQLNAQWTFDPDISHASEVEVRFIAEAADRTRVELEHRHFERHGEGAEAIRTGVSSPDGWSAILQQFVDRANSKTGESSD